MQPDFCGNGEVLTTGASRGLFGCLPTYHQIGVWAPVLLVVLRFVQGFTAMPLVLNGDAQPHQAAIPMTLAQRHQAEHH
ncbi:hypothetical protein [Dickeya chrysanthemi]|uniref:hypothetical protein n=1 Tax=Dickeya chrysanthemi TaxID=556 RepID=UPI0008FBD560|nr:hypothetical protein [Dickeya chrysanthemi]